MPARTPTRRPSAARMLGLSWVWLCLILAVSCTNSNQQQSSVNESGSVGASDAVADSTQIDNILIFGTSLTAGYGLDASEEPFPEILQRRIDSLGLPYRVINAGLSGETSAAGKERIDWLLQERVSIFVLELGANDGLRGIPTEETYKNLQGIIDKVLSAYPDAKLVLAGMLVPPNMGDAYARDFAAVFPKLAEANEIALIPFLLDGVAGDPALNLNDGIHPNARGQQIVADNVWEVLEPLL